MDDDKPRLRLYIDAKLSTPSGAQEVTFGPFSERLRAEQALLAVMGRADVRGAIIRDPDA